MKLGSVVGGRDNNFTAIRLLAAVAVIVGHSFAIVQGHDQEPGRLSLGVTPSTLALDVFFVVGGFLVSRSLDYRRSALEFVCARLLRIFPGLLVCLLVTTLLTGPYFTTASAREYFAAAPSLIARNLFLLPLPYPAGELPGLTFTDGPLWSLPVEICCYVVLLCGWLIATSSTVGKIVATITLAGAAWRFSQSAGLHLAWMFASGAVFYRFRNRIVLGGRMGCIAAALILVAAFHKTTFAVALLLLGPYVVLCAAYVPAGSIRAFNRMGDYSYGLYIYGYPAQFVVRSAFPGVGVWTLTASASALAFIFAALSWHIVEKRSLSAVPSIVADLLPRRTL